MKCIEQQARKALRAILFAYKDVSLKKFHQMEKNSELLEKDFSALSLMCLMDPLKPSIKRSIETVKNAHLKVIMCTGDNIDTATAIAAHAGILQ